MADIVKEPSSVEKFSMGQMMDEESLIMNTKVPTSDVPELKFRDVIIAKKFGSSPYEADRVQVEYFSNEKNFKERLRFYLIKNQKTSQRIRYTNFLLKLLACILYMVRVYQDDTMDLQGTFNLPSADLPYFSQPCWNKTEHRSRQTAEEFRTNPCINWDAILYSQISLPIYISFVLIAIVSYFQTLLLLFVTYKGSLRQSLLKPSFLIDSVVSFGQILTLFWPTLRYLQIPVFLNCWLAKRQIENIFNDIHRASLKSHSAFGHRIMVLTITMISLCFTGSLMVQHLQRGGNQQISLFEGFWYITVTVTTVGYGDIYPDIWPSQLSMIIFIFLAFAFLPTQFEQVAMILIEKKKRGTSYSKQRAESERHVVVSSTNLDEDIIMDFLNEFYAHTKLQNFYCIILSPCEMNQSLAATLQAPMWSQRVIYIQGTVLNSSDLIRCQMELAEACFILASRNYGNRQDADQHTTVRSWAVKDFAPNCTQYIHIFKPETKMHLQHAKYVVCEDEMKYALLANNCLCPGLSTFMTLILHTSRGKEGTGSNEEWQKNYGKCSGNEIYHIKLCNSKFFKEYEGKSFTFTSFHSHRKFGIALIGVQEENGNTMLNPGPSYIMKISDICFYMSLTKEENSSLNVQSAQVSIPDEDFSMSNQFTRKISFRRKSFSKSSNFQNEIGSLKIQTTKCQNSPTDKPPLIKIPTEPFLLSSEMTECNMSLATTNTLLSEDYIQDFPPSSPYVGCSPTICYLMRKKPSLCCLKLIEPCAHTNSKCITDYKWRNKTIILAAEYATMAIYNFIVPLRSYSLKKFQLNPILLLLDNEPDEIFLKVIRVFPMVYWMKGAIDNFPTLLQAGIGECENLIIINKETPTTSSERSLKDARTIMAAQYIFRMFPKVRVCSEIKDSNNMRFMKFKAQDHFSQQISKREKFEKAKGSQIHYLFRLPFAAGSVFSASMLDTLLYQSFLNPYLIKIVRLMIGIDQAPGSGHLNSRKITHEDSGIRTYGRLYQNLCSSTYDIPIGIYRTETIPLTKDNNHKDHKLNDMVASANNEIEKFVKNRLENLQINQEYRFEEEPNEFSYVIINPAYDLPLKIGDTILLISHDRKNIIEFELAV